MCLKCVWRSADSNISRPFCVYNYQLKIYIIMNSKIAELLAKNITNDRIVADMIMFICNNYNDVEDHLIDLCLDVNAKFVTKDMIMKHIDKIKPLCMQYMTRIEDVDNIKVVYIDNIVRQAIVDFTAKVTAWFKDQEDADEGDYWCSNEEENEDFKVKGTCTTTYSMYIPFKDIDI